MSQISSLAVGQQKVASLDFTQSEVDTLKAKLLRLTEAKITVRVGRDAEGKIAYGQVDDVGIQLAATVKALEFGVGKPKQMIDVKTGPGAGGVAPGVHELGRLLVKNPDITARILGALKDGLALSEAIPVEAVTSEPAQTS